MSTRLETWSGEQDGRWFVAVNVTAKDDTTGIKVAEVYHRITPLEADEIAKTLTEEAARARHHEARMAKGAA